MTMFLPGSSASPRPSRICSRVALLVLPILLALSPCAAASKPASADEATSRRRVDAADSTFSPGRARHLALLGVDGWHKAGVRGRGMKVAILDSGFRGYKGQLGGPLPANVVARSFRRDGNLEAKDSQHGILCGEVIHALAPEAKLLFANWELERVDEFLGAVRWAREQGARIISCSVVTPNWSDGKGGGAIHQELAR